MNQTQMKVVIPEEVNREIEHFFNKPEMETIKILKSVFRDAVRELNLNQRPSEIENNQLFI